MVKRFFLFISLLLLLILPVSAAGEAHSLNNVTDMRIYGEHADTLLDGNLRSHSKVHYGTEVTVSCKELIGGVYLEFSSHPGAWTLQYGDKTLSCGGNGFLHEYIPDLNTYSLTLRFQGDGILANVYVLSPGEKPDWVQDWLPCWDRADVLLLPTHSDDDTLFFGGIVPWCIDKGARVQVAYLINHSEELYRTNELLNGLWTSGLRNYPVLGEYEDLGPEESLPIERYEKKGISWDDMIQRQVRLYRQFKPHVVICHDSEGEYGHGAHKLYWKLAVDALELSGDSSADPASVARNGVWIPDKLYVHLLKDRPVVIDLDEPLRSFDYKTGYDIARKAFECHESQYDYFSWYFWGAPTADRLQQYSSREYGLYYSSVGDDISGKTFFDNISLYDQVPEEEHTAEEELLPSNAPVPETEVTQTAPPSVVTPVNPRLDEIHNEQRGIIVRICALAVLVLVLLMILRKLKSKERGKQA